MAMKQTQTKLFDFSDVGLDFCAGSKSLFPDRFKKMFALGYNEQTVSSVTVADNQVTFTYGGAHGYAADRVLKVDSGALASINNGEFWIDSVTINTVTMVIDNAPLSVANGFTTRIASLGWSLEYEVANIHIYKFKYIDETDLYLRLCFQNNAASRNNISPCIGKSYDVLTGEINDPLAYVDTSTIMSPNLMTWEFSGNTGATANNYSYSQGYSTYGRACVVGSAYHLVFMHTLTSAYGRVIGFVPATCLDYDKLDKYPLLICENPSLTVNAGNTSYFNSHGRAFVGQVRVDLDVKSGENLFVNAPANASFLPSSLDSFNTTTARPIMIYEFNTKQYLGAVVGGLYSCMYANTNAPPLDRNLSPVGTRDIDLDSICKIHFMSYSSANYNQSIFLLAPVEEVKIEH